MQSYTELSHPEHRQELEAARQSLESQLLAAAREIDGYRQARKPGRSARSWVAEWPGLGSAKTWSKILKGDFSEMCVEAKLPDYRAVLAALAAQGEAAAAEELYDDLAGAQAVTLAALRLMLHHGKDRLLLIKGGSGSGKTSALDLLELSVLSGSMYRSEANDAWKSERVAMHDILRAMGEGEAAIANLRTTGAMLERIIAIAGHRRTTLAIDEAHHCTGRVLNLIKTILNRTGLLVILAGMATLIQKLRSAASEESKQLFHNRLFCSVSMTGPDPAGVGEFLRRRLSLPGVPWKTATLATISQDAANAGHWSYLRRICGHLHTDGIPNPNDADLLNAATAAAREIA